MNCAEIKNHMEKFLNGSLGGAQSRRIRAHMASCAQCVSSLTENDRIEALASRDEAIEPSPDFHARFMSRLESHRAAKDARLQRSSPWWRLFLNWNLGRQLAAAGALAAVVLTAVYLGKYRTPDPAAPPNAMNDIAIAENLSLLQDMRVIENLDLLEDFDSIQNLNATSSPGSTVQ